MAQSENEPSQKISSPDGQYTIEAVIPSRLLVITIVTEMVKRADLDWLTKNLGDYLGESTDLFFNMLGAEDYEYLAQLRMAMFFLNHIREGRLQSIDAVTEIALFKAGIRAFDHLLLGELKVTIHDSRGSFEEKLAQRKATIMEGK